MLMFFLPLQELRKQTENPELQADITEAIDAIQTVLDAANNAIDKEHLATAVADLAERVDDWKLLKVDSFGELLRFGTFTVVKGDTGKDSEREVYSPLLPMSYTTTTVPCFYVVVGSITPHTTLKRVENGTLTDLAVPHLPFRANPSMLQRYQSKQTEEAYSRQRQAHHERKGQGASATEGTYLYG